MNTRAFLCERSVGFGMELRVRKRKYSLYQHIVDERGREWRWRKAWESTKCLLPPPPDHQQHHESVMWDDGMYDYIRVIAECASTGRVRMSEVDAIICMQTGFDEMHSFH